MSNEGGLLALLRGWFGGVSAKRWRTPPSTRLYAVGDIHGRDDLLERLMARILEDGRAGAPERRVVVFLGDYVDRGPGSADVLDLLAGWAPPDLQVVCLKGNHEAMMMAFLAEPEGGKRWIASGGAAALASYGITLASTKGGDLRRAGEALNRVLPAHHRRFLEGLALSHVEGDYCFVHAGLRPGRALKDQDADDLLWIRKPFLTFEGTFPHMVVHGHTPSREPVIRPHRLGIDTGAWTRGMLTCVVLEGSERRFLSVKDD
ncbi:metallophosphoesterase family protein [Rhodospirillum rubrum]|uniref:Metallophosphoesterase n=1 Tax=Rhodospirillum rubrum (strain ATCC 11170 / ATH 1.1.1 / DSM 467 / LMG 4362 / NCIMB 8255 / S1) TaxID=269796 RepID=Q2RPN9_RHORT|nr:metallophosphoesterase family protein [Rhodospirillum rubrum]ABC23906.1 Metallophosphoesterase [Rhodospirillum rubrum ATCC 11170]AEO49650.1 metallophosphoesterase [Rhodospirillum rubrum F11]MBK5955582.1 serine/threonine protein phosphatase [Rhodospirillum rubrum]QXG79850.1 serine/threonine protein phosphatase [Rhodospirillum rubrum]HAP99019.1 serine/threonine protein phosphatase [Rhodospirillum rubrum]